MNLGTESPSRREFLKAGAIAEGLTLLGWDRSARAQGAAITAAKMRAEGTAAKILTLPLRGGVFVLTGSGGDILVTSGEDGMLAVDSGFATSKSQIEAVAPGVIAPDMSNFTKSDAGRSITLSMQAIKRIGQSDDVADVIAFLASDKSRWITGASIPVDGGSKL